MKFKNIADIKHYLYVSKAKLQLLYQQVGDSGKEKKSFEWKLDLKALSVTRKSETEEEIDDDDRLKVILDELQGQHLIGTVDEGKPYIKGIFPMRWGIYNDSNLRPDNEGPLVWFSGIDGGVLLGLGGSSHHIVGCYGLSSTSSRSVTPTLVRFLRGGMETGELDSHRDAWREPCSDDSDLAEAMALANNYVKGPVQMLEFVAKVLWRSDIERIVPWTTTLGKVVLATPLYVAQVDPMFEDG